MIKKIELKEIQIVKEIMELQLASYIIEARLMAFYDNPPLKYLIY